LRETAHPFLPDAPPSVIRRGEPALAVLTNLSAVFRKTVIQINDSQATFTIAFI
jgi:hypothetical protein